MHPLPSLAALGLTALALAAPLTAQLPNVSLPTGRYIDFSAELNDPNVTVLVATVGKCKDGKRERLEDGKLGGVGQVSSISGTQYFKVPVQTSLQVRKTFEGKADKPALAFDVQLARLPDGKEQRQAMTPNAPQLDEGTLAMFVLRPRAKGKGYELLHAIAFDKEQDKGADAEAGFVDTMHDFFTVNRRVADLEQALKALDTAVDPKEKEAATKTLKELMAKKPELKQHQNDTLWMQHIGGLEERAQKRLQGETSDKDAK